MGLDVFGDIILLHNFKSMLPALHTPTGQVFWTKQGQDNEYDCLFRQAKEAVRSSG